MEQTLVLRILVPSSKETTGSGDENVGCVGVGRSEAFVSDTQAVYTPLPPTATLHPIVGQQSQISQMKQLQWAATRDFLNQPSNSVEWLSSIHSLQHSPPHLRTRSFLIPVVASILPPSFSLYIGFEVQRSRTRSFVFFLEMLPHVKVAREMIESKKREPRNFLLFFESQSLI